MMDVQRISASVGPVLPVALARPLGYKGSIHVY
jgi:hypothetical protein